VNEGERGKCGGKTIDCGQIVHITQPPQFLEMVKIYLKGHKCNCKGKKVKISL
jgi:hypothetical protein